MFDVYLTAAFALFGYVLVKLECEPAPLILGFILGPMMEENLRRTLLMNRGDASVLLTQPLSLALLIASVALVVVIAAPAVRRTRDAAMVE